MRRCNKRSDFKLTAFLTSNGEETDLVQFAENDESHHKGNGENRSFRVIRCDLAADKFYVVAVGLKDKDGNEIPNRTDFVQCSPIMNTTTSTASPKKSAKKQKTKA